MSELRFRPILARAVDLAVALAGLVTLAPLLAFAALWIACEDGTPVFFRQIRVGRRGRPFEILKFRTMCAASDGPAITVAGDRRVTRVGAWLRLFKIDELPQMVNVLRGEMSLIGPRPEVPEYVDLDTPVWQKVLAMRPGITDLASLAGRNEEEVLSPAADPDAYYRAVILPEKLQLNLRYQRTRTWWRDLKLLWMTAWYSLFPRTFDRERVIRSLGD